MKETIGFSNKNEMLYMGLALCCLTLLSLRVVSIFPWIGMPCMLLLGFSAILLLVAYFRMPKGSVCREGECLLLYRVWRRYQVAISDVISVEVVSQSGRDTATLRIKMRANGAEKAVTVLVTNKTDALKRLKELICKATADAF